MEAWRLGLFFFLDRLDIFSGYTQGPQKGNTPPPTMTSYLTLYTLSRTITGSYINYRVFFSRCVI